MTYGTVYLAGPISGLAYNEARFGWRSLIARLLNARITVLSPMRAHRPITDGLEIQTTHDDRHLFTRAKTIFAKDRFDISRSDIVLVNLLGAETVSIGTMVEIGIAAQAGKTIVLVIEDEGNIHDHPFVTEPAAIRVNNLEAAADAVNRLLSDGV